MTTCPRCAWLGLVARVRLGFGPNTKPKPKPKPKQKPKPSPTATAEQAAFYMVGPIEEVVEKAAAMAAELEAEGK